MPTLSAVSSMYMYNDRRVLSYIRAANDFRKAKDKLRQAELKGKDTHKAAQVVRVTEAEFDKLSKLVPHVCCQMFPTSLCANMGDGCYFLRLLYSLQRFFFCCCMSGI